MKLVGTHLNNRYKIVKALGDGAFGETYLAEDTHLPGHPICVVKKLKTQGMEPKVWKVAKRLFHSEADILQTLGGHDQIPQLFAHFEENQEFYLIEEFIEGHDLSEEMISGKPWSDADALALLQSLLPVLVVLFEHKVIHRDIKPSNIRRRDKDGQLVLIDFGAVKEVSVKAVGQFENLPFTVAVSTTGYTPIEQSNGRPSLNSDLYALGMTVVEALTGIHPSELPQNHLTGEIFWEEQAQVTEQFASIINQMICSDWTQRYQSPIVVLEAIQQLLDSGDATLVGSDLKRRRGTTITTPSSQKKYFKTVVKPQSPTEILEAVKQVLRSVDPKLVESQISFPNFPNHPYQKTPTTSSSQMHRKRLLQPQSIIVFFLILAGSFGIVELIYPIIRPAYHTDRGNQLLDNYFPEKSLDSFDQVIYNLRSDYYPAWKGKGDALMRLSRYEGALAAYDRALQLKPEQRQNLNNIGKILYQLGRLPEALATHETAIELDPKDAEAWNGKGLALLGLGRYEAALNAFQQARKLKPQFPKFWESQGLALEYLGREREALDIYAEAKELYDIIVEKNPKNAIAWVARGDVLHKLNNPEAAIASYDQALKINPRLHEALLAKAITLSLLREYNEALDNYNQAIKVLPQDYITWYNRGQLLAKELAQLEEALQSFEKTLELREGFYPALLYKGLVLSDLERYQAALAAFNQAKEIKPDADHDPYLWINIGFTLEQLGEESAAIAAYQKALKIDDNFAPAIEALQQLGHDS